MCLTLGGVPDAYFLSWEVGPHLLAKEIQAPGELPKDTVLINRAFQR